MRVYLLHVSVCVCVCTYRIQDKRSGQLSTTVYYYGEHYYYLQYILYSTYMHINLHKTISTLNIS